MSIDTGILDEAFERFHATGPEFNGFLTNHGPMAVEAMVRHGHDADVHRWIDRYSTRLDEMPRGLDPVTPETWQESLGARKRTGDWTVYMLRELQEKSWRELLVEWWPRLLPGVIAGSTHAAIRTGHAVRALLLAEEADGPGSVLADGPKVTEFAHALAYWAAAWQPIAGNTRLRTGDAGAVDALAAVPAVAEQSVGVSHRIGQLETTPGWDEALAGLRTPAMPQETAQLLSEIADAAVLDYLTHGQANPVMLVHSATAPTAILRTLPALPTELWAPSLDAAWHASAAILAAYRNVEAPAQEVKAAQEQTGAAQETFERAVRHGDEHVVKLADTALEVYARTSDQDALAAVTRSTLMIARA